MRSLVTIISLVLISAASISCNATETEANPDSAGDRIIVCEVFYRPSAGLGLEAAPLISFSGGDDHQFHEFETMAFEARFQDDDFEGQALSIAITNMDSGTELFRQLYQFDPQNPVENQFIGGHGFTGLNYVFQPGSSAEMQYFCSLN